MKKIAYLGPKGTFTALAVKTMFPDEEAVPYRTIPACIDAVKKNEVDYTIVPIENTIEGSVNLTIDYLVHEQNLPIVGEITVPIKQHLMVHPENKEVWKEISTVISHSHAIAQCHQFLHSELPDVQYDYMRSTAAAAEFVYNHPDQKIAAIGNELAAAEFGLEIVKYNIHDYENNHTRFVILHKDTTRFENADQLRKGDRTTLMITMPSDYAGALHQVLSAFAWRKLNLSKIESRPMKTGLGNYFFIIDIEMPLDDVLIPGAIAEIEALGCSVQLLGSYPFFLLDIESSKKEK